MPYSDQPLRKMVQNRNLMAKLAPPGDRHDLDETGLANVPTDPKAYLDAIRKHESQLLSSTPSRGSSSPSIEGATGFVIQTSGRSTHMDLRSSYYMYQKARLCQEVNANLSSTANSRGDPLETFDAVPRISSLSRQASRSRETLPDQGYYQSSTTTPTQTTHTHLDSSRISGYSIPPASLDHEMSDSTGSQGFHKDQYSAHSSSNPPHTLLAGSGISLGQRSAENSRHYGSHQSTSLATPMYTSPGLVPAQARLSYAAPFPILSQHVNATNCASTAQQYATFPLVATVPPHTSPSADASHMTAPLSGAPTRAIPDNKFMVAPSYSLDNADIAMRKEGETPPASFSRLLSPSGFMQRLSTQELMVVGLRGNDSALEAPSSEPYRRASSILTPGCATVKGMLGAQNADADGAKLSQESASFYQSLLKLPRNNYPYINPIPLRFVLSPTAQLEVDSGSAFGRPREKNPVSPVLRQVERMYYMSTNMPPNSSIRPEHEDDGSSSDGSVEEEFDFDSFPQDDNDDHHAPWNIATFSILVSGLSKLLLWSCIIPWLIVRTLSIPRGK